jgi:hypothetical protein
MKKSSFGSPWTNVSVSQPQFQKQTTTGRVPIDTTPVMESETKTFNQLIRVLCVFKQPHQIMSKDIWAVLILLDSFTVEFWQKSMLSGHRHSFINYFPVCSEGSWLIRKKFILHSPVPSFFWILSQYLMVLSGLTWVSGTSPDCWSLDGLLPSHEELAVASLCRIKSAFSPTENSLCGTLFPLSGESNRLLQQQSKPTW